MATMTATSTDVSASLHFLKRDELYEHEKPYSIQYFPHGSVPQSNVRQHVADNITIHDVRSQLASLDFDRDGFVVRNLKSELTKEDFAVPEKVKEVYLEEVKALLCELLDTRNVAVVEYLVRRRHQSFPVSTGQEFEYAQPVATAHIDFSPDCLVEMIRDRYAHRADALLKHRYRIVNVWKPLAGPLHDWPLVLCKPASVDPAHDLQLMDRVYPTNIEESIQVHFNAAQEWCYLSGQKDTEVLVFRGGDSAVGIEAGVPHCSFNTANTSLNPSGRNTTSTTPPPMTTTSTTPQVQPRESVEVRALVFDADEDLDLESVAMSRRHGPKATYQQQQQQQQQTRAKFLHAED